MVRRNNYILGSAAAPVKEILVRCTIALQSQCMIIVKSNKMKHLNPFPKRLNRPRNMPRMM
jgi:hypothetical protein